MKKVKKVNYKGSLMINKRFLSILFCFLFTIKIKSGSSSFFIPEPPVMSNYNVVQLGMQFESSNSYLQYVTDIFNNQYLLKQKKNIPVERILLYCFRDVFAALIAYRIKLPLNLVWFIAAHKNFPGKKIVNYPATLHTLVPGTTLFDHKKLASKISLKQWSAEKTDQAGLTETVIRSMALHKDLPPLVAFDTITSNADRHNKNLLYDAVEDKFYGIDMDSTFRLESKIVLFSCENIIKITHNKAITFNKKELTALKAYRQALKHFLALFSLSRLHKIVDKCFEKIGMKNKQKDNKMILAMHTALTINYKGIKKLIGLVDKLIAIKSKKNI